MTILPKKKQTTTGNVKPGPHPSQSGHQDARQRLHHHSGSRLGGGPERGFDPPAPSSSRTHHPSTRGVEYDFEDPGSGGSGPPPTRRQRMNPRPEPITSTSCSRTSPPRSLPSNSTSSHAGGRKARPSSNSSLGASGSSSLVSARTSNHNSPHNSEDEYEEMPATEESNEEIERRFEEMVKKKGFTVKKMTGDGACLFRAVSDQIYGDQDMHGTVRRLCMDYMEKNRDYFSQFITEDFVEYIKRKRADHVHGNQVEMQAMAEVFSRPVHVYQYSSEPINTFQTNETASNPPIRVSYHGGVHYNSVVDPYAATIGVGLGLPSFHPGSADKKVVQEAVKASENDDIERTMLEDKLRASDREATEEKIDEQVARDSYLQWIREQELKLKETGPCHSRSLPTHSSSPGPASPFGPINSGQSTKRTQGSHSSKPPSPHGRRTPNSAAASAHNSPPLSPAQQPQSRLLLSSTIERFQELCLRGKTSRASSPVPAAEKPGVGDKDSGESGGTSSSSAKETDSIMNQLSPSLFGLEDWGGENDVLQQIMALSQKEYLESLKKQHQQSPQ